jgi:ABC-type phosphate transport system auxiliary subunit
MAGVHLVVGVALIGLNLLAAAWGGVAWLRGRASIAFWYLLRAAQVSVFFQVMLGSLLVVTGHEAADGLHYLYGVLPLPVSLLAEGARTGAAEREIGELEFESLPSDQQRTIALAIVRREMGIMTVGCIVIFFLALRAAGTSSAF